MGLIASSSYLVVFATGTLVGASTMFFIKFLKRQPTIKIVPMEERFEFPDLNDEVRLVMGIRSDLKMQKGKVAAQCGHASVAAYAKALKNEPILLKRWMEFGGTKITVKIESEKDLLALNLAAEELNVMSSIVRDAGQTQVAPGSRTVIAIGPAPKSVLDKITGHLKLY